MLRAMAAAALTLGLTFAGRAMRKRDVRRRRNQARNAVAVGVSAVHPHASTIAGLLLLCEQPVETAAGDDLSSGTASPAWWTERQEPGAASTPRSLDDTPCILVRTPRQLRAMGSALSQAPVLALDTEHHAQHSYLGQTCLLQLSTGQHDYIVDVLALQDALLHSPAGASLRAALADPRCTKLAHGCGNDVLWLQRDCRLHIVNVFDTERAAQVLGLPHRSLAALLHTFCGVSTDKALQRADWRQRPLTPAMLLYARTDVHYLPHIAARLREELWRAPLSAPGPGAARGTGAAAQPLPQALAAALRASQMLTLAVWAPLPQHQQVAAAAAAVLRRVAGSGPPDTQPSMQLAAMALCQWRDSAAREVDESPPSLLADAVLAALLLSAPSSPGELLRLLQLHAGPRLHPVIRRQALQVLNAVQICRQQAGGFQAATTNRPPPQAQPAPPHPSQQPTLQASYAPGQAACSPQPLAQPGSGLPPGLGSLSLGASQLQALPAAKRDWVVQRFSAKTPVYENCMMLAHSGQLLCYCDQRKANWYLAKGLAVQVGSTPLAIQLLFEHKDTDQQAGSAAFYSQTKSNRCVVCGETQHYLRYRVVPACYRRNFPVHLKSHRSHDVVLLCMACHQTAQAAAEATKRRVAKDWGVPLMPPMGWQAPATACPDLQQQQTSQVPMDSAQLSSMLCHADEAGTAGSQTGGSCSDSDNEHELPLLSQTAESDLGLLPCEQRAPAASRASRASQAAPPAHTLAATAADRALVGDAARQALALGRDSPDGAGHAEQPSMVTGAQARRAALALQRKGTQMPASRVQELEDVIRAVLGRGAQPAAAGLRPGDLEAALLLGLGSRKRSRVMARMPTSTSEVAAAAVAGAGFAALHSDGGHGWHGQQVVAAAQSVGGDAALMDLITRFRSSFVDACKPRYLPSSWDVHHQAARDFGCHSIYTPADKRLPPNPPAASLTIEPSMAGVFMDAHDNST